MNKIKCAMLIDDNANTNLLHEMVIEDASCIDNTLVFNNSQQALDYLADKNEEDPLWPSIIFLDINMPKIDGWEFIERLKNSGDSIEEKTIIVLLTTSSNFSDQKKAEKISVIKEYLQKPLNNSQLNRLVEKYF